MSLVIVIQIHCILSFCRDLLDKNPKKKYELRENKEMGVYVKDVQSFVCKSVKQIERIMAAGNQNRTIG